MRSTGTDNADLAAVFRLSRVREKAHAGRFAATRWVLAVDYHEMGSEAHDALLRMPLNRRAETVLMAIGRLHHSKESRA